MFSFRRDREGIRTDRGGEEGEEQERMGREGKKGREGEKGREMRDRWKEEGEAKG